MSGPVTPLRVAFKRTMAQGIKGLLSLRVCLGMTQKLKVFVEKQKKPLSQVSAHREKPSKDERRC